MIARRDPTSDEKPPERKRPTHHTNAFVDKSVYLVKEPSHLPDGRYYAFQAYALRLSSILRRRQPRCEVAKVARRELRDNGGASAPTHVHAR